jgi:hypothetical protein
VFDSPLIPVTQGDSLVFASDQRLFRPRIALFDERRDVIKDAVAGVDYWGPSLVWDGGAATASATTNRNYIQVVVKASRVRYVKFDIHSGNDTTGIPFERFGIHKMTRYWTPEEEARATQHVVVPVVATAEPEVGFAPLGYKISNLSGGWFTAVRSSETKLARRARAGETEIGIASPGGITRRDLVGVELDSGAVFWTRAKSSASGGVVELMSALPQDAADGRVVVSNGWANSDGLRRTFELKGPTIVAPGACLEDLVLEMDGAAAGGECVVGTPDNLPDGVVTTCRVGGDDTIELRICNFAKHARVVPSARGSVRAFNP